jgi:hypothetical protein
VIRNIFIWIVAVIISLASMVYQRLTGPTYPQKADVYLETSTGSITLPRTYDCLGDCPVDLVIPGEVSGNLIYRKYPSDQAWDTAAFLREADTLRSWLPAQPPAGKLEYHIELQENGHPVLTSLDENVVIRFKGCVPSWALTPHVILMIFAMLWSNATGLLAAFNRSSYRKHALVTIVLFAIGGLIFGPIVQKYAFGAYWTGWPFGEDLTDNKVLFSVIVWVAAYLLNRKKERRWLIIVAALVLFAIYMIPHSMRGSELDYTTGEVVTGGIAMMSILLSTGKVKKKHQLLTND